MKMRMPLGATILGLFILTCGASSRAGSVCFGDNPIIFTPPVITGGDGILTSVTPIQVALPDGFMLEGMQINLIAGSLDPIDVEWTAERDAFLAVNPLVSLKISGQTNVTIGADGTLTLTLKGFLDGREVVSQTKEIVGPKDAQTVKFSQQRAILGPLGLQKFTQKMQGRFVASAADEEISWDSFYELTAQSVPEPGSWLMIATGCIVILFAPLCGRGKRGHC